MDNLLKDNDKEYLYRENQNAGIVPGKLIIESQGPETVSDKSKANAYDLPLYRETGFKPSQADGSIMKKYRANFVVMKDEDGILCAADLDQGIFADGKTKEELMADIREAVECHFDVSPENVDSEVEICITGLN
jgi:predicted RNase H-like HicB family nuclease